MRGAPIRNVARWILLLLALAFTAYDVPQTWHNYGKWRLALPSDSVAAGFWRSAFYSDVREMAVVLGLGIALWFILKARVKRDSGGERKPSG